MAIELEISAPISVSGETTATILADGIPATIGAAEIRAGIDLSGSLVATIHATTNVDVSHRLPDEPPIPESG